MQIIGIDGLPQIKEGDSVPDMIVKAVERRGLRIKDGDVLVVAHKIVSKAEGRIVSLTDILPSDEAKKVAKGSNHPAEVAELALREARSIVKQIGGRLLTQTSHGWVYSYSGVDVSNVSGGDKAVLLPRDPDASASRIRWKIRLLTGKKVAVIVSDTSGRPFRKGAVDVAIGVAGIDPMKDLRGMQDGFGMTLRLKRIAVADELASAAELVMGQAGEMIPVAILRGYEYTVCEQASSKRLRRPLENEVLLKESDLCHR